MNFSFARSVNLLAVNRFNARQALEAVTPNMSTTILAGIF
jgi:hypothetical protein